MASIHILVGVGEVTTDQFSFLHAGMQQHTIPPVLTDAAYYSIATLITAVQQLTV